MKPSTTPSLQHISTLALLLKKSLLILTALLFSLCNAYSQEFWGMTKAGGADNKGIIFKMNADGSGLVTQRDFTIENNGNNAQSDLTLGANGKLYGTTGGGGFYGKGVLFEYDPATGVYTRKVDFDGVAKGDSPSSLALGSNGKFYGMTGIGGTFGAGVIFEYDPATNVYTKKFDFDGAANGAYPFAQLALSSNGKLYGVTSSGGTSSKGVLFEYDPTTNTYTKKIDFDGTAKGDSPYGSLALNSNGKFYGMTYYGGTSGAGVLFEFDPSTNGFIKKIDFTFANGANPVGCLILNSNAKYYGMTGAGGTSGSGVLFEYDPATNVYTKKVDFNGTAKGAYPYGSLLLGSNGKFYGMTPNGGTSNGGVLFEYDPATNTYTKKFDFNGSVSGDQPGGSLTEGGNGKFYATTITGGTYYNGVLFEYDPATNVYTKKLDLSDYSKGITPSGSLMFADNGNFYGTCQQGGTSFYNSGVLFEYNRVTAAYTKKVDFNSATEYNPNGSLTSGGNGKLYGLTSDGPSVLFEYDPAANVYTKKVSLSSTARGGLILASNGKLYGTTDGSLFEYEPLTGTFTSKITLTSTTGSGSVGRLVESGNGKLYGVTTGGGTSGFGVLFEYDPTTTTYTKKFDFDGATNGSSPSGSLAIGANGKLYGVTATGGASSKGVLFEYDPATSGLTKKIDFDGTAKGSTPKSGLALSINAKLYGMTSAGGTSNLGVVFEYDPATNTFTKKFDFNGLNGASPECELILVKQVQTITFNSLPSKTFGDAPFNLSATASSGLPVSFSSSNTAVATVSGNTVTIVGVGTTTIQATQPGNSAYTSASASQLLTVNKANQSITFAPLANKTLGDAQFTLAATASTSLTVSYTSSNTSVATVSGNTVTILSAGSTVVTASQAGNANYNAAPDVPQTLTVNKANQVITFGALASKTFGDAAFALTASGGSSSNAVTFASSNTAVATVAGNTVTIVGTGTTTITASQAGNANYNAAADVPQTFTVNKQNQVITFGALSAKTFGDIPFALSATGGTSGNAITFASSNTSVAVIVSNVVTIVGGGTTTITASQAGNANYNAAADVPQTLTVNKANQAITFNALAAKTMGDGPFVLSAAGGASGNAVTFISSNTSVATVLGNVVTIVGAGSTIITASQASNTNYNAAADVPQSLTVSKGNQTITFGTLSTKTFGDAGFGLTATASSALLISYASSNTSVATVSGNMVTIVGAGSTTITASQAGNTSFNAATGVPQTLTVNKMNQSIAFGVIPVKGTGDPSFTLSAASTSSLAISYASSNTSVATVSGNTVSIVGAGTAIITASQTGNTNYNAATDVQQTLVVNGTAPTKTDQTITFNTLADKVVGDAAFNLTGTATSALTVTYASSNTTVATVSGNLVTVVGAGITIITASQAGNSTFNAAVPVSRTLTINKTNQTITFNALADKNLGDANFNLTAAASSSLAISYASSNTSVATVSGSTVTIVGAGTTIITASQAGNGSYNSAASITQMLTVGKTNQTITFSALATKLVTDPAFTLTATASSGLPITYTIGNTAVATISGNTVTIVGAGTTTITANQSGNSNYSIAQPIIQTLTVNKLSQTVTLSSIPQKTVGDAPFDIIATASSGLPLTFASNDPTVATMSGNTVTIVGAGVTFITIVQSGNATYNTFVGVATLSVVKANQNITFNPLADKTIGDAAFNLTGTASSGLAVSYSSSNTSVATVAGSTATIVGAGTSIITASQNGNAAFNSAASVTQSLTVNKANQSITFNSLTDKNVGDANFNLTASASSALATTFTSSNTSVATVSGNTVTIVGAGSTIITASQAGNASYNAATSVTQTLTVNKVSQTITFSALADKAVGDTPFVLAASASSSLPINYSSSNTSVATVSGSTVTIVGAGTSIITAAQSGNSSYNSATPVSQTLTVNKSSQTITFGVLANKVVGDAVFNLTATASSGLTISYTSSNTGVAIVSGSTVQILAAGTTIITASQAGNATYSAASSVSQALTVTAGGKTDQTIAFGAIPDQFLVDGNLTLAATASSGLQVSYTSSNTSVATVSGNVVTFVGGGVAIITASQAGNVNYNPAIEVARVLIVRPKDQTITFNSLPTKTFGDAPFTLAATATSGLPVSYFSSNTSVAVVSDNLVTIIGAGTATITAWQGGNKDYDAADNVDRTLVVNKANQTITFNALSSKTVGDATFDLAGISSAGLSVSYASSNTSVATISGRTVTIVGAGSTVITASQTGTANYNAATDVQQALNVSNIKADQTITFNTLADRIVGDADFTLTATAASGLAISYASSNTSVATISGSTVTIVGAGSTIITASQSGNSNFNAAVPVTQILKVKKATQTITFDALTPKSPGDSAFDLTATTNSGLAVSYVSSNTSVATISGSTVTIVGAGTSIITASQSGNTSFYPASSVSRILTVNANANKLSQTITFDALADKTVGDAAIALPANASSGLAVTYSSSNSSVATIAGNIVTIVGAGSTVITASQQGDASFSAATIVIQSLTVNKKDQTIAFSGLADKTVGNAPFNLTATASSGLGVTFSSTSDRISLAGTQVTISRAGRATIVASQTGNATYKEASSVSRSFCIKPAKPTITLVDENTAAPLFISNTSEGNQWFLNDAAIVGATNATFKATAAGVYKLQVKVDDCISEFSDLKALIVTGTEKAIDDSSIEIYPNPAADLLTVSFTGITGKKGITIHQLDGREIASQEVDGDKVTFLVSDYAQAVYIVRIKIGSYVKTARFIKL